MEASENKLKITPLKLGLSYAGCFLGVGYISGQELWTFFGGYGPWGLLGAAGVLALLYLSGLMLLRLIRLSGESDVARLVVRWENKPLRLAVNIVQCFMMFFAMTVMVAGSGALAQQMFALPAWLGSVVFGLCVGVVAYKGLGALLRVFAVVVPLLTGVSVLVCALALAGCDWAAFSFVVQERSDPVMRLWPCAALLFFSYNLFASIGVLPPIGRQLDDRRIARRGIALGTGVLCAMTFGVLLAMNAVPASIAEELPMVAIASRAWKPLGIIFAVLLLGGMFGTSSNCSLYTLDFLTARLPFAARHRLLTVLVMLAAGFAISLFGFSGLIGTLYPIFGYFGVVMFLGLLEHYLWQKRRKS